MVGLYTAVKSLPVSCEMMAGWEGKWCRVPFEHIVGPSRYLQDHDMAHAGVIVFSEGDILGMS